MINQQVFLDIRDGISDFPVERYASIFVDILIAMILAAVLKATIGYYGEPNATGSASNLNQRRLGCSSQQLDHTTKSKRHTML